MGFLSSSMSNLEPTSRVNSVARTYFTVQALRLVAALLVVFHHAAYLWNDRVAIQAAPNFQRINAQAGVDVFFVISGFVMGVTAPGLLGVRHKAWVFIWRRLVRIVPLYWLFTTLKVVQLWSGSSRSGYKIGGWWQLIASYLFISSKSPLGYPLPVLSVGWTLNFEILFYVLFAVALLLDLSLMWFLSPVLLAIACVGWFRRDMALPTETTINPLVLEFWYGLLIAQLVLRGRRPGWVVGLLLFGGGMTMMLVFPQDLLADRAFSWGLPAAAIVWGAIALEEFVGQRLPRWTLELGNASYAVYLIHPFVVSLTWVGLLRINLRGPGSWTLMIISALLLSTLGGEMVHRLIELPLLNWLRGKRVRGVSVLPVPSKTV